MTPVLAEPRGSCAGLATGSQAEVSTVVHRLLVIGDSTAAGVGVEQISETLPSQLADEVAETCRATVRWRVCARRGATAASAVRKLVPCAPIAQDVVVVIVGVNDALQFVRARRWRQQVVELVDALSPHLSAAGRVVLVGLPDLGRFGTLPQPLRRLLGWHAQALDHQLRDIAGRRESVAYVAMPDVLWPDMFARDGFHPNTLAYRDWAGQLTPTVAAELRRQREGATSRLRGGDRS